MKKLLILFSIIIFYSCENTKEYKSVHYFYDSDLSGKIENVLSQEEITIEAKDDTTAFVKSYMRYKISEKMQKGSPIPRKYDSFKVYTTEGVDISDIDFKTKIESMRKVDEDVDENVESIGEYSEKNTKSVKIDSVTVKKLKPKFKEKTDKFDSRGITWVQHNFTPKYRNQNGFYCYFAKKGDYVDNFRFVWQYLADDWLFVEKIVFLVDNVPYDYHPINTNRDNDSDIWEWGDEQVKENEKALIEAIAKAKSVEVRFIGKQYTDDKKMSSNTIKSIKETLEYYKALGGKF